MKLKECAAAYRAVCELAEEPGPFALAHALVCAKQSLTAHVAFFTEKELDLIAEYGGQVDENGHFQIAAEKLSDFQARRRELEEVEVALAPLPLPRVPERLSGRQLEALLYVFVLPEGTP